MGRRHKLIKDQSGKIALGPKIDDAAYVAEHRLRRLLAERVNELLALRRVTQTGAAALLDISQPNVSEVQNYKLDRFTSGRLLRFLTLLDRDIDIVIRPKGRGRMVGLVRVSID